MNRDGVTTLAELAGASMIAVGLAQWFGVFAALIFGGAALIVFGYRGAA